MIKKPNVYILNLNWLTVGLLLQSLTYMLCFSVKKNKQIFYAVAEC